jgi:2,3-dihydroxyethylbenzene 1,2-dioxygenase
MNKVAVTELGYVGFGVKDLDAWRTFTSEILGMEFVEIDGGAKLRTDYWHHRVILQSAHDEDLLFAGFRVAGPEEFRQMQSQLEHCGVAYEVATQAEAEGRCVLELLRLNDPAGNPLEIFHGPQVDLHKPFRPGRGMHGHFVAGTAGLGHVILRDAGVEQSYRFYSQALGMRGSVESFFHADDKRFAPVFMHCNERGHTVAFGAGDLPKRIHHLMLQVTSIDDVGLAYDLMRQHNFPILIEPGKHSNDRMFSFYAQTPSGWNIEYGWGGERALAQSEYNVSDIWGHRLVAATLNG